MNRFLLIIHFFLLVLSGIAAAETEMRVHPGTAVDIHFLCRLENGDVVASTDKMIQERPDLPKSTVFLPVRKDGPIPITALVPLPAPAEGKEKAFEEEIVDRLAGLVVGMKVGERKTVKLTSEDIPERGRDDYVLRTARIWKRPKEMKMKIAEYRQRTGKIPEEKQAVLLDPAIPGTVKSVTQEEVSIAFSARTGETVSTSFGPGHVREREDTYEIAIDARKGALVRVGHLVGRIVDVGEEFITSDFRNPFGGETLICDLTLEKIIKAVPMETGTGKQ